MTLVKEASLDAVRVALDPLPDSAPPIIIYQPDAAALELDQISVMRQELEYAAIRLFPAWLPGAEHIAGPQGAGVEAVRALALARAKASHRFGPYLADLAEAALRGGPLPGGNYAPTIRAGVSAWVIAQSYERDYAALVIDIPTDISQGGEAKLASAADWIAGQSGMAVWLTGHLSTVDKYIGISVHLEPVLEERTGPVARPLAPVIAMPPLAGRPRADSAAECALEAALRKRTWAEGRCWNQTYQSNSLARPFRLDLWWRKERCVVEIDGPEHHQPLHYAADRRRDVQLQLDGHAVLRYTNDQVLGDLDRVISEIGRLVRSRRSQLAEKVNT